MVSNVDAGARDLGDEASLGRFEVGGVVEVDDHGGIAFARKRRGRLGVERSLSVVSQRLLLEAWPR